MDVTGTITFDKVPVGTSAYAYVLARASGTNAYRAAIRVSSGGLVYVQLKKAVSNVESNIGSEVAIGLSLTPGSPIGFRFRLVGSHLSLRAWDATGAEPADLDGHRHRQHGRAGRRGQCGAADLLRQCRLQRAAHGLARRLPGARAMSRTGRPFAHGSLTHPERGSRVPEIEYPYAAPAPASASQPAAWTHRASGPPRSRHERQ